MNLFKRQKTNNGLNSSSSYLQYNGGIYYHKSIDSTNKIANQLLDKINSESDLLDNKLIVGFDCEWKAFPRREYYLNCITRELI